MVIWRGDGRFERYTDLFTRLMDERLVFLTGVIDDDTSTSLIAQLMYLEAEDPTKPISMYINSPGGSITAGMAIYDTMQYIRTPVHTMCLGTAASMASVLLAAGEPGHRMILPNATVMIHQPSRHSVGGQASDIAIHAKEIVRWRTRLTEVYQTHCGRQTESTEEGIKRFNDALERDFYLTASEAVDWRLVDTVISKRPIEDDDAPEHA